MIGLSARSASSARQLAVALRQRIDALSRAHSLIRGSGIEEVVTVSSVIGAVLAPHVQATSQVHYNGPKVRLDANTAVSLSMVLHELTTNALKYGALSMDPGRVSISWTLEPTQESQMLVLCWRESGGPPIDRPERTGFGSSMINQTARAMGGGISFSYPSSGLEAVLTANLPSESST